MPVIAILILGVSASFLFSRIIQHRDDAHTRRNAEAVASALARVVEQTIEPTLSALDKWPAGPGLRIQTGSESWEIAAGRFLVEYPAISAMVEIDRGRVSEEFGPPEEREKLRNLAPGALDLVSRDAIRRPSQVLVLGPVRLSDGRGVLGIPVVLAQGPDGPRLIFALFEATAVLKWALDQGVPGYSLRVRIGDQEIFDSVVDEPGEIPEERSWQAVDAAIGTTRPWTVIVRPTQSVVERLRQFSDIVLVAGLLISALLALTAFLGLRLRSRTESLVDADFDLWESREEIERDEIEIRDLRDALDVRVAERTATLADTISDLETFNYSVSHDLRSPIGAVINLSAILVHDYGDRLDDVGKDYLQRISESAKAAVDLMDALLAYSRSAQGEIRKCTVDMHKLVESVVDDMRRIAPAAVAASIEIGDLPRIDADPGMMRRVFANLISNSIRFAPAGECARITIGGSLQGGEALYFVRDEGIGFDMRYADKLFRAFERLHSSEDVPGHGVGLAIVARLVRRHGGRIWAQGAVSKGATFFFTLPVLIGTEVRAA